MQTRDVQVSMVKPTPLVSVRRLAAPRDLSKVVPEGCGLVWNAVRAQHLKAGRHVAVYWDGQISLDVGVECDGPFATEGEFRESATPGGLAASVTHFGPYGQLGSAHDAVRQWCEANRYQLVGPSWEVYGHWQDEWNADPSRIRTDVYYLVAPASATAQPARYA